MYVSQILNFNEEYSNMPIYKALEMSWILNILRKESIFLYLKIIFFTIFRGVYFFRCGNFYSYFTWPCTDISKKSSKLRKWWLNLFPFLYTDQMWRVKRMWYWKISLIVCDVCYNASYIKKIYYLEENWQVISTLPPLMIIKLGF